MWNIVCIRYGTIAIETVVTPIALDINMCQNLKLFLNIYLCTAGGIHPPRAVVMVK